MSHSSAEGRLAALQRHLSAGVTLSNGTSSYHKASFHCHEGHAHLTKLQHVVLQVWSCSRPRAQENSAQHLEGGLEL